VRSVRHWTPGYVTRRLRQMLHQRRHPAEPWLTGEAVRLLDSLLRPRDRGFEWGSGRSTLWLSDKIAQLTSVESDPRWYQKVRADLEGGARSNVELLLREIGDEPSDPAQHPFVRAIDAQEDGSLDFALVDGWGRSACALAALDKLKPGGLLVIDDAHRYLPVPEGVTAPGARTSATGALTPEWERLRQQVADWRSIWTSDGVSPTLILVRSA